MAAKDAGRSRVRGTGARFGFETLETRCLLASDGGLPSFDVGTPTVTDLWVDPVTGDDRATGAARSQALRTVSEAWQRIPAGTTLSRGFRIDLVAGTYGDANVPAYWENRLGTATAPVIIAAADGPGSARLPAMNVAHCTSLYLEGLSISAGGGDVLHLEACASVLVRDTTILGTGSITGYDAPQEALKVNQSRDVFVEGCDISGAWDNAIDFVAVQGGHVVGSRIHRAGDWAMYVKGGSVGILVAGNEIFDAGTGGFTAGQGTGLEWMVAPWLTYEATDIVFSRNTIHDTDGAGVGVNGGKNVSITGNVMYRVGARSHVIEVGFGTRSCDGDRARCSALLAQGAWGTDVVGVDVPIPDDGVTIAGNVILNPDGYSSRWQQFSIAEPRIPPAGSHVPSPARADVNLVIEDNILWNGDPTLDLGIADPVLAARVLASNSIDSRRPMLVDPPHGDYRLSPTSPRPAGWLGTPVVAPPVPSPPAPPPKLTATIHVAATTGPVTAATVTFNRAVHGVSIDDFTLVRGRTPLSLRGARVTTTDGITYTISGIRGTGAIGLYTLTLRAARTGIADQAGRGLPAATAASWRLAPSRR